MKHFFLSFLFISLALQSFGQEIVSLKFNPKENRIEKLKNKYKKLKFGDEYLVKLENTNSAYTKLVVDSKSFSLLSDRPAPLASLIAAKSSDFQKYVNEDDDRPLIEILETDPIEETKEFLDLIKGLSSLIYENIKSKPADPNIAMQLASPLFSQEDLKNLDKTTAKAELYVSNYVKRKEQALDAIFKTGSWNESFVHESAEIAEWRRFLDKNDFQNLAAFIQKSVVAESFVKSDGFEAKKDGMDLKIAVIDTFKKDTVYKGEIEFINYGKWSFDFSTGFMFSGLTDNQYYLGDSTNGRREVFQEEAPDWDVVIGGFAHLTYKLSGFLSFGPQIGIGVSIFDERVNYATGLGFLLGRRGKINVSGGVSFGKVKELSGAVKSEGGKLFVPATATEVPTFNKFDTQPYFAITYNLAKKKF